MKQTITFHMLIVFFCINAFCQINTNNSEELLKKSKVKHLMTYYYQSEDTTESEGRVLIEKKFNNSGQLVYFYEFVFWTDLSFNETTTYKYDNNANLIETLKIVKTLNLTKRDREYIDVYGNDPNYEKTIFTYNKKGQLIGKKIYKYGNEGFNEKKDCHTLIYKYLNNRLYEEISTSPYSATPFENHHTVYKYNSKDLLSEESTTYYEMNGKEMKQSTVYTYNDSDKLIEKVNTHNGISIIDRRTTYKYDDANRLIKETDFKFNPEQNKWIEKQAEYQVEYQYNEHGNRIKKHKSNQCL
jgi:hypothetical protein